MNVVSLLTILWYLYFSLSEYINLHLYVISGNETDSRENIPAIKPFIAFEDLLAVWRSESGDPSGALSGKRTRQLCPIHHVPVNIVV